MNIYDLVGQHPYLTFFLALAVLEAVVKLVRDLN
jgi:hypothetical protein